MFKRSSWLYLSLATALSASACTETEPLALGDTEQDLAGAQDDTTAPAAQADVVVQLENGCSGTLITPTAVLTAMHCVCGASSIDVRIGPNLLVGSRPRFRSTIANPTHPAVMMGTCPHTVGQFGNDLAIIFLDESVPSEPGLLAAPVMSQVIHRPTLIAPCAVGGSCPDVNGGTYSPALGMAGFGGGRLIRQIAFASVFEHEPGYPDNQGQYWTRVRSSLAAEPGDSGSPLFVMRTDAMGAQFRDPLGVASTIYDGSDYWTDITRGATRAWLVENMRDNDPRHTPAWRAQHPSLWRGELDYIGPCQSGDRDCDHFYDAGDNCPDVPNPDQFATQGVELGDACNGPAPATPPASCSATLTALPDEVTIRCTSTGFRTLLQLEVNGTPLKMGTMGTAPTGLPIEYVDHPLRMQAGMEVARYRVCNWSLTSQQLNCSPWLDVALPVTPSCSAAVFCGDDVFLNCAALSRPITYAMLDAGGTFQELGRLAAQYTAQPFTLHPGNPYVDSTIYRVCNSDHVGACALMWVTLPHQTCTPPPPPPKCRTGYHWCGESCVPNAQHCE